MSSHISVVWTVIFALNPLTDNVLIQTGSHSCCKWHGTGSHVIIIQRVIPWQLAEVSLAIHVQLWKCACTSNTVTHHNFLMSAWTGIYQTGLVLMLQANGKKHMNIRQVSPGVCWGCARGHFLLCGCGDHAGSVTWGNHEGNLQEGTTFWGCLTLFRVWQAHCL